MPNDNFTQIDNKKPFQSWNDFQGKGKTGKEKKKKKMKGFFKPPKNKIEKR